MTCVVCGNSFERRGSRGPIPKYCSQKCITKASRTDQRRAYEREYIKTERSKRQRQHYAYGYNRRPEVMERQRKRMLHKWHNDPEYRDKQLARWVNPFRDVELPLPYTGHRWLDTAREVVTSRYIDPLWKNSDDYYDDMGVAVLALLEGQDPDQAVKEYRKKEYAPRRLWIRLGDWGDDEDEQRKFFEKVMPTAESAEDTFFAGVIVKDRFNQVSTKNRGMKHKTQQPSERRKRNGASWQKHL